jgi:hypothetical protein
VTLLSNRRAEVPSPDDLLCESCGYTLNGLPDDGNCPECGEPVRRSTTDAGRGPTAYEIEPSAASFWSVTGQILLRTKTFYRTLSVKTGPTPLSARFSLMQRVIVGAIAIAVLVGHLNITGTLSGISFGDTWWMTAIVSVVCGSVLVPALAWIGTLASKLSAFEAGWWGMRLPLNAVRRAMDYHSAAYVPVAIGAFVIIWGYLLLRATDVLAIDTLPTYLYVLAGYVIVAAGYLFRMFVIAMTSIRWANQ